jgi:hypothetical protein
MEPIPFVVVLDWQLCVRSRPVRFLDDAQDPSGNGKKMGETNDPMNGKADR